MSGNKPFGKDSLFVRKGYWKTTGQHLEQSHTVTYSKKVGFLFRSHAHPFADDIADELERNEIDGLLGLDETLSARKEFEATYAPVTGSFDKPTGPVAFVDGTPPIEEIELDYETGAYAVYNWELFFHAPFTVAVQLSRNGLFAEAQRWFHYIFDPTAVATPGGAGDPTLPTDEPKRFWKFREFQTNELEQIEETLGALSGEKTDPKKAEEVVRSIEAWRSSPLRPHLVARTRPVAYMYATVMAYLDNLIAWGDSLFRRDTAETINEAMLHYVAAANLLGPKPQVVPNPGKKKAETYDSLRARIDAFGNASVEIEANLGATFDLPPATSTSAPQGVVIESIGRQPYFCLPRNEKFIGYWDTIADRLFKIRNSLNLAGVFRQLPLFAPPIDPALLALAEAAGVDFATMLSGSAADRPTLRFGYWLQKATELAQRLESFGSQILQAIEKKDNETLAVIRAKNEKDLLSEVDRLRKYQWQEAIKAREGVEQSIENAFIRYRYYQRLLGEADADIQKPKWSKLDPNWAVDEATGSFGEEPSLETRSTDRRVVQDAVTQGRALIREEKNEIIASRLGQDFQDGAAATEAVAALLNLIPMTSADVKPLGLGAGVELGGMSLSSFLSGIAGISRAVGSRVSFEAAQQGKMGGYVRREQEWAQQANAASGELNQLHKQYRAAEVREAIAKKELDNHLLQRKQSEEVYEFLSNAQNLNSGEARKLGDEKLYLWMKGEAQALHARCHTLAHDVAKYAERQFQWELMEPGRTFVRSDYTSGKEGLFAGERLGLDLKAMERAYAELNTRKLELTKHVSLREWFPNELIALRKTGTTSVTLPEALFDLDGPNHTHRRIQAVSLSIPCITGPYASVHCRVSLDGGSVRLDATATSEAYSPTMSTIVTSTAQNDTGMFETSLRDERYLPFEGGSVNDSQWSLSLLGTPAFDFDTIADVVMTIRYTARENATDRSSAATKWLEENVTRMFAIRHEFSSAWALFKRQDASSGKAVLKLELDESHFSYRVRGRGTKATVRIHVAGALAGDVTLRAPGFTGDPVPLEEDVIFEGDVGRLGAFELELETTDIDDLWLVITGAR